MAFTGHTPTCFCVPIITAYEQVNLHIKNDTSLCFFFSIDSFIRPNKKISVFRVTGLKILSKVSTHFFHYFFSFWKEYYFMHFERHFAFQNV